MLGHSSTAVTLALVFGSVAYISRADHDEGSIDGDSGEMSFSYEYGPCAFSSPSECLSAAKVLRDDTQRRIECAWFVPKRDYKVCWDNDNGEQECQYEEQDQSGCGYCSDIYADGYEYASYTCDEVRSQLKKNGQIQDTVIYCRDDEDNEVPQFASYYCADLGTKPYNRTKCIQTVCESEFDTCMGDESDDGCKQLIDELNDEVAAWENCTANSDDFDNDEDFNSKKEMCMEQCPARFRYDDDYFSCTDLYPYYSSQYCADDSDKAEQYADACEKLSSLSVCNAENCDSDYCEKECPSAFNTCYFTAGCYAQISEFEQRIEDEQQESDEDLNSDPFGRYIVKNIYEEYCDELEADDDQPDCLDEFRAIYDCARPACLADRCLTQDECDAKWETCFNDDACMSAFNYTFCAVEMCGDDDSMDNDTDSDSDDSRRRLFAGSLSVRLNYPHSRRLLEDGDSDGQDQCCQCCTENGQLKDDCSDDCVQNEFQCSTCDSDGSDDGQQQDSDSSASKSSDGDDRDNEPEMIFLITNYMKWFYEFRCEGSNCENEQFEEVLDCVTADDSACAEEFEKSNVCIGGCKEAMKTCFEDETCGAEFDEFWKYQQYCDGDGSDSSDSMEMDDDCNAWRYNDEDELVYGRGVSYQQYQCFDGDGCSDQYRALWVCLTPCFFAEEYDEQREECEYYDDKDCDDDDGPFGDDCLVDCDEQIADCMYDSDCFFAVSEFFENTTLLQEWLTGQLQSGGEISEDSFQDFLSDDYCNSEGVTCNDKFTAVSDCLWEQCLSEALPCFLSDCSSAMIACYQDSQCREETETYLESTDSKDGSQEDSQEDDDANDGDDNSDNDGTDEDDKDDTDGSDGSDTDDGSDTGDGTDDTTDGSNGGSDGSDGDDTTDDTTDGANRRLLQSDADETEEEEDNSDGGDESNTDEDDDGGAQNGESSEDGGFDLDGLLDFPVKEYEDGEGTQEDRDAWTKEVYDTSCNGDSDSCSQLFTDMVECIADACIYDTQGGGSGSSDASSISTLLSVTLGLLIAALAA